MKDQIGIFQDTYISETLQSIMDDASAPEDILKGKITQMYVKKFHGEKAIAFKAEGSSSFKQCYKYNMDEQYNHYYNEYYHKFDPLKLLQNNKAEDGSTGVVQNIAYSECKHTEYYNEFLLPQNIYYKLLCNLKNDTGTFSRILLMRSEEKGNFSQEELRTAAMITPYFSFALDYMELKREVKEQEGLYRMIEDNLTEGVILLDGLKHVIHANCKAKELCGRIGSCTIEDSILGMHPIIAMDYLDLVEEYKIGNFGLPRKRIFQDDSVLYSISSKYVQGDDSIGYFLISIRDDSTHALDLEEEVLKERYNLSRRELEVVGQLIKGLTNLQIARQLYISEITVKKHLENIFHKTGVNNRTALVQLALSPGL